MNKENIPTLEEYTELVKKLFINNCLQHISEKERIDYLNLKENKEIIEECYEDEIYMKENFEGYENVFSEESILSRTCRSLEKLY